MANDRATTVAGIIGAAVLAAGLLLPAMRVGVDRPWLAAAMIGLALGGGSSKAWAGIDDYEFQLVQNAIQKGDAAIVAARLVDKRSGKVVPDAVIFAQRVDMAPDGMDIDLVGIAAKADADAMLEAAIDAGADDVVSSDDGHEIYTSQASLSEAAKALEAKFGEPRKAALIWKPQNNIAVSDEVGEKLFKLLDLLNEHDDVQNVYANFEVSDALAAKMAG